MSTLTITLQLLLSLSILVITHEFGHFFFSKLFGVKVEKFYMFFDVWFSIFKYIPDGPHKETSIKEGFNFMKHTSVNEDITPIKKKEFDKNPEKYIKLGKDPLVLEEKIEEYDEEVNGKKETWVKISRRTLGGFSLINYTGKKLSEPSKSWWHNTDFGLGWLPLGGYCAITGMVDETQGADKLNHPVQDFEFRAKPAWQRLLIMVGGVLVNFITAPLIFWFLLFGYGERYIPFSDAPMGLQFHEVMKEVGFQDGDIIVSIDGVVTETYKDIANTILFADTCTVQYAVCSFD